MRVDKLFQVLVVGGGLLVGSSNVVASRNAEDPAEEELSPIFCTTEGACVTDCEGNLKVKDGFYCCWGTSCGEE